MELLPNVTWHLQEFKERTSVHNRQLTNTTLLLPNFATYRNLNELPSVHIRREKSSAGEWPCSPVLDSIILNRWPNGRRSCVLRALAALSHRERASRLV